MSGWASLRDWFAGNGRYTNLVHCMGHDTFWIVVTVALDFAVAAGYLLIALHWRKNQRYLADSPAKHALGNMRNIFLFCGICGYLFIPVKMVWPAWRLYDLFMVALVYTTWRYAWNAKDLKVVMQQIGYFDQRQAMMQYGRWLKEDLVIASGQVEGAVRHLVGERLDCSGMRWVQGKAEAILHLRCIELNGDWPHLFAWTQKQIRCRLGRGKRVKILTDQPLMLTIAA